MWQHHSRCWLGAGLHKWEGPGEWVRFLNRSVHCPMRSWDSQAECMIPILGLLSVLCSVFVLIVVYVSTFLLCLSSLMELKVLSIGFHWVPRSPIQAQTSFALVWCSLGTLSSDHGPRVSAALVWGLSNLPSMLQGHAKLVTMRI